MTNKGGITLSGWPRKEGVCTAVIVDVLWVVMLVSNIRIDTLQ